MCNEYQLILPFDDIIEAFNLSGNRLVFPGGMLNFGPMASIRIGDRAPIIQLGPEGPEAVMTPWAWKGRADDRSSTFDRTGGRLKDHTGA